MSTQLYPRFSETEFARRHAAATAMMTAEGVDALVIYGDSGVSRHNHADIHYLSGFLGNRNNYVAMTAKGEPALYVQSFNHVPNAREASSIRTEWGGASSAAAVARHLIDAGLSKATLGYVGDVPVQSYLAWQRELAGWQYDFCVIEGCFVRCEIERDPAIANDRDRMSALAAQKRSDPCQQLDDCERFDKIVVGTKV